MTQEKKELLRKVLCVMLPYGIKCYYNSPEIDDDVPEGISVIKGFQNEGIFVEIESGYVINIDYVKPYLRPMSSMTEEEKDELERICSLYACDRDCNEEYGIVILSDYNVSSENSFKALDWLNEHYFDYRGLIEKGLALEAPENMYKIWQQ